MIRRSMRLGIRLGLLAGIAVALFKLVQSRRSASELGRPSGDWATVPTPAPSNLPPPAPEPELIRPVVLEEIATKRPLDRPAASDGVTAPPPGTAARDEQAPAPAAPVTPVAGPGESVLKKAAPAKRAATKKAAVKKAAAAAKAAAKKAAPGAVKKAAPAKKAAAVRKAPAKAGPQGPVAKAAPARKAASEAVKKAAPAKKAAKKQRP